VEGRPVAHELVCQNRKQVELSVPEFGGLNTIPVAAFDDQGASSNVETLAVIGRGEASRGGPAEGVERS
jgi:hypothetical protein